MTDVSILLGMTDREMREAIAKGDSHGRAVLEAMLWERRGNPPSSIEGGTFRLSNTTQLLVLEKLLLHLLSIRSCHACDLTDLQPNWNAGAAGR